MKFRYLIGMLASSLILGMTSCSDDSDDVPEDGAIGILLRYKSQCRLLIRMGLTC